MKPPNPLYRPEVFRFRDCWREFGCAVILAVALIGMGYSLAWGHVAWYKHLLTDVQKDYRKTKDALQTTERENEDLIGQLERCKSQPVALEMPDGLEVGRY